MRYSFLYLVVPALVLISCGSSNHERSPSADSKQSADSYIATADSTDYSSDIASLVSPSRKRIRAAGVRCRVTDVFAATTRLEQTVIATQGVIVSSTLKNEAIQQHDLPYTSDSIKRVQLYTPVAELTLKVPVACLDSVVHTLTAMAGFIDHRTLTEKDVTLDYLTNALKNNKDNNTTTALVPDKKTTALDIAKYKEEQKDKSVDRSIANLEILQDVAYATFTVELFQPEQADIQVIVNPAHITRAGFTTEMWTATRDGAVALRNILLVIIELWPFWLIAALIWWGYRSYRKI